MMDLIFTLGSRALVIVAHPDDETIWFGGTMLANPQVDWTILCMSRINDSDRSPKFFRVAKELKAKGLMDDWDDDGRLSMKQSIVAAKKIITSRIGDEHYDFVITHGANGEYGHERHIGLHEAVKELVRQKKLSTNLLFTFNYKKTSKYQLTAKADSDLVAELFPKIFKAKKSIMTNLYGFDPKGIDTNYCTNPEALKIININKLRK